MRSQSYLSELSAEAVDKSAIALLARLVGWFNLQRLQRSSRASGGERCLQVKDQQFPFPAGKKKERQSGLNRENPAHH